jgi:hypothetical protein
MAAKASYRLALDRRQQEAAAGAHVPDRHFAKGLDLQESRCCLEDTAKIAKLR